MREALEARLSPRPIKPCSAEPGRPDRNLPGLGCSGLSYS